MEDGIELRQLRSFAVLAEERHFGRAAERLGIAQPSLSQQIARLEGAVGHALVVRRPRFALTPAGEQLLRGARTALREAGEGVEAARRAGRGEAGRLTLGFGASVLLTGLSGVVRAYQERFPGVRLHLRETPTARQVEALREGSIDVGLSREPVPAGDVEYETLLRERFLVVLPPGHPLAGRRRLTLGELRGEPVVLFPREAHPALHDRVLALCREAGFETRIVQESTESLTVLALVNAGVGISLLPTSYRGLRFGGVVYRPLDAPGLTTELAVCRRRGDPSPTVDAFVALAREMVGGAQHRDG